MFLILDFKKPIIFSRSDLWYLRWYGMFKTAMKKKITRKVYQYTAVFEPDKKLGGFTVTIPSLPGCISEGDTFEESLKNIKEAAALYVEVMQDKSFDIL